MSDLIARGMAIQAQKSVLPLPVKDKNGYIGFDKYQTFINGAYFFANAGNYQGSAPYIPAAIKRVQLFGVMDPNKQLSILAITRNKSGAWAIQIGDNLSTNGTQSLTGSRIVCQFNTSNYTEPAPSTIDVIHLAENNGSGIEGLCWIDWNALPSSIQWTGMNWYQTGLHPSCYSDANHDEIAISLPQYIPAIVGQEMNVYFDNVIQCNNLSSYQVQASCSIGTQLNERFTVIPTTAGSYTLTLSVFKNNYELVAQETTTIKVAAANAQSGTKQLLCIGDSMAAAGAYTQTLLNNITGLSNPSTQLQLTASGSGSALPAETVYVQNDFVNQNGRTTSGTSQNSISVSADQNIVTTVTLPPCCTSFGIYVGNASNPAKLADVSIATPTLSNVTTENFANITYSGSATSGISATLNGNQVTLTISNVENGGSAAQSSNNTADPMQVTLKGTIGTAPNVYEGRSGWTLSEYLTSSSSPFVFSGTFNFSQYMTNQGYTGVTDILIELGTNDISGDAIYNDTYTNMQTFINGIRAWNSTVNIHIVLTIPPEATQDGWGYMYGASNWRNSYKSKQFAYVQGLIGLYDKQQSSYIYVVPFNSNIDTANNFPTQAVCINGRNTTVINRQTQSVHPATAGYQQMGDTLYYHLKNWG